MSRPASVLVIVLCAVTSVVASLAGCGRRTAACYGSGGSHARATCASGLRKAQFFVAPNTTYTPRILKDGADSVGALGAHRVYINIGLFSEEWLLHFRALIGGAPIRRSWEGAVDLALWLTDASHVRGGRFSQLLDSTSWSKSC